MNMSVDTYLNRRIHGTARRIGQQVPSLSGMTTAEKWDVIDRLDAVARQQQMAEYQAMDALPIEDPS